ncbi:MAG: SO_0444 family Cu/Zn efflux transporter [Sedimenticola sp.]|nr:SO_0444 family Cu/Zn efflux transporter [Sedimenticola sp.]MCW9022595.1 SO_0444 family Cu/Zn efflux transporter [Sedimenticola sp.]
MNSFLNNTLALALDSAPWLLFGLLAAGVIQAWLPIKLVGRSLGGHGVLPVIRAAIIGAPLPLCSCSTLPAAISLRRAGASKASTTAFLIATPETGVDSVALSWVLLGPVMAIIRPLSAILSAITAGLLVGRIEARESVEPNPTPVAAVSQGTECGCCSNEEPTQEPVSQTLWGRTWGGLVYAFTDLLDDLALWLLVGLLVAGLVITLVPPNLLNDWGSGFFAMLLIMLISVPMYVCATASTPLAHAMLFAGVSPGTVLVFLLAGPASNLAGLILVRKELGTKALYAYLFGVGGVSILLGLTLDWLIDLLGLDLLAGLAHVGNQAYELPLPLSMFSLLILLAFAIRPVRRYLLRGKVKEDGSCCS